MPRGPRSQSTPPSSTSSSSTFGRGKTSALESLCSASANSSPILPSTSGNQRLERVDEEGSDGEDGHPPTSSSPSGTTTHSHTSSGGSSHADPNPSSGTSAEKDSLHPTKVSAPPHNTSTKDTTVASPSNTLANPLYAVLRSGANPDEPSVRSPDDIRREIHGRRNVKPHKLLPKKILPPKNIRPKSSGDAMLDKGGVVGLE
ncbi:hypothetical protein C8R42DRAFT_728780 [Lentinula raphanica]|nr:hypothetical protein C8R42DRAFT_728780 [Lentinula raphanica]